MDCGDLDNPDNGQVSQTGTTFGSTATYNCGDGYELDGEKTRTCQANEKWSGTAPRCRRKCPYYPIYSQANFVLLQFLLTACLVVVDCVYIHIPMSTTILPGVSMMRCRYNDDSRVVTA